MATAEDDMVGKKEMIASRAGSAWLAFAFAFAFRFGLVRVREERSEVALGPTSPVPEGRSTGQLIIILFRPTANTEK